MSASDAMSYAMSWPNPCPRRTNPHGRNEMCRLSGRHGQYFICAHVSGQQRKNAARTRFTPRPSTKREEYVDASSSDSCVRLPPYCSLLIVKYDISCGEIAFSDSVWVLRACWVALAAARLGGGFQKTLC